MLRTREAEIVATLGPAGSGPRAIRALFEAGAGVFRFDFGHGTHEDHRARHEAARAVERETGCPIAVPRWCGGPADRPVADPPVAGGR